MRHSAPSTTRILTILSLVVLSALSFAVVYGTPNIVDTPPQDSLFTFHKHNVPHYRRVIHHLRAASDSPALTPTSSPSPTPSDTQPPPTSKSKTPKVTPASSTTPLTPASSSTDSSTSPAKSSSTPKPSDTTTSTTSSTPTPSSTLSSTPSSSSTTSSSSSKTSPTTSITPGVFNLPSSTTRPSSITSVTSNFFTTPSGRTSTITPTSTAGAASRGFFANKVAVGVTFGIVGVICGLALIVGAITVIRRYRRANDDDEDFYEKYSGAGAGGATDRSHASREPAELGQGPLGASATDLGTDTAPFDAYPDRAIHYGHPNPSTVFRPVDYGIDYPPDAAAYADPVVPAPGRSDIAYDNYDYDPTGQQRPGSASSHPFADPANASRTAYAPPVTYPRIIQGRSHEMVTTDSYYGPNSAGVGAGIAQ